VLEVISTAQETALPSERAPSYDGIVKPVNVLLFSVRKEYNKLVKPILAII
jgi:hypothetical protein